MGSADLISEQKKMFIVSATHIYLLSSSEAFEILSVQELIPCSGEGLACFSQETRARLTVRMACLMLLQAWGFQGLSNMQFCSEIEITSPPLPCQHQPDPSPPATRKSCTQEWDGGDIVPRDSSLSVPPSKREGFWKAVQGWPLVCPHTDEPKWVNLHPAAASVTLSPASMPSSQGIISQRDVFGVM